MLPQPSRCVAAAIALRARFFYTFDRSQAELARAANLLTM